MTVTNRALTNIHVFPTEALFASNASSIANTDLAFIKISGSSGSSGNYDVGNIVDKLLGQNGYIKYSNGLIIQWGKSANTVGIDSPITIPFNTSFSSTVFTILTTSLRDNTATGGGGEDVVRSWTMNDFYFYHGNDYSVYILWMAIGI